jgi:hypothetical protein
MGILPNRACLTMGVFPSSSGINKTHLEFRSQRASDNATVLKLFPTIVEKHHGAKQEISYKPSRYPLLSLYFAMCTSKLPLWL